MLLDAVATTGETPATRCIAFQSSRLAMGYSFSLGLSFLIGANILKTSLAPTWNDIGQLGAIYDEASDFQLQLQCPLDA